MNAYSKTYLEDAMDTVGIMFDCAINNMGCSPDEFSARLSASGISDRLSRGEVDLVAGKSGVELAMTVMRMTGAYGNKTVSPRVSISSKEYWAGAVLAYYQWKSGFTYRELADRGLSFNVVCGMFNPMHEADISAFERAADRIVAMSAAGYGWLKVSRKRCGMTQEELAELSGVSVRLIRAYEQGVIATGNAEYDTVSRLKRALGLTSL